MSTHDTDHLHTLITHSGRPDKSVTGAVNPHVVRASTIQFPTTAALYAASGGRHAYGRHGTESAHSLEAALCALEGAQGCLLTSSGLSAVTTTLLALLSPGDHVLMPDSVYQPARHFCDTLLTRMGIETEYYDPLIGADIARLLRPTTRVVYVETPGTHTFEMQDVPAIAAAAHAAGAVVVSDSTWATPIGWRPFELGVDVSIHAATKYIVGHSDVMMGAILCTEALYGKVYQAYREMGQAVSPDDAYLALRGVRTLSARLAVHRENARKVADWLLQQPEVATVLYPPHEASPGHALWKRDFHPDYACGLMGLVFKDTVPMDAVNRLVDQTRLFAIGYSWGGYESLILPSTQARSRDLTGHRWNCSMARLHIGLEAVEDLLADLQQGFAALRAAL